eukprot:m.335144 g.335144  ORF g.335144 m.335144 type:complete len:100 (+) comp19790_c2_seq5:384-683(+)
MKFSALYCAAWNNHASTAEILISHGADLDQPNKNGWTPLHAAVRGGAPLTLQMLLDSGVNVDATNNVQQTANDMATDPEIKAILANGASLPTKAAGKLV